VKKRVTVSFLCSAAVKSYHYLYQSGGEGGSEGTSPPFGAEENRHLLFSHNNGEREIKKTVRYTKSCRQICGQLGKEERIQKKKMSQKKGGWNRRLCHFA